MIEAYKRGLETLKTENQRLSQERDAILKNQTKL